MTRKPKLRPTMSLADFDNGYWYALELKEFAKELGIPSAGRLRKDELEAAIKSFLRTGKIAKARKPSAPKTKVRDSERGLTLRTRVIVYTNDSETKEFLEREAARHALGMKCKSGARYRLNRWREAELAKGRKLTYGDLAREYARLNETDKPFKQIPHGRYINFVSDFFNGEAGATRAKVTKAWKELKALDVPKDYASWKRWKRKTQRKKK